MTTMRADVLGRQSGADDAYPAILLGRGKLATEHAASSYGLPVWVSDLTGRAHGPRDLDGELVLRDEGQSE